MVLHHLDLHVSSAEVDAELRNLPLVFLLAGLSEILGANMDDLILPNGLILDMDQRCIENDLRGGPAHLISHSLHLFQVLLPRSLFLGNWSLVLREIVTLSDVEHLALVGVLGIVVLPHTFFIYIATHYAHVL